MSGLNKSNVFIDKAIDISFLELIAMAIRKTDITLIVRSLVVLKKAGIIVPKAAIEAHILAGGNAINLVEGLVYAKNENLKIGYKSAMTLELKNKNLPEFFRMWKLSNPDKTCFDN